MGRGDCLFSEVRGPSSKVVKKGPRGKCFGLFGSAGSITRIVAPILAGILAEKAGEISNLVGQNAGKAEQSIQKIGKAFMPRQNPATEGYV